MLYKVAFENGILLYGFFGWRGSEKKYGELISDVSIWFIRSDMENQYPFFSWLINMEFLFFGSIGFKYKSVVIFTLELHFFNLYSLDNLENP
jgi:hypothetical protein